MRRSSILLVAAAVLMVGAGAFWMFRPRATLPADLLKAVPADAYGVARIRVDRVLASEAYKRLIVEPGHARGIEHVREVCGFNPLDKFSSLIVFARPSPERGAPRLAFVARGALDASELVDCVNKLSPKGDAALRHEDIEGITTVASKRGSSRAALVGSDGLIAGDAESVRAAIHTMLGKAPSLADDARTSGLYRELEQGGDIAATTRLTEEFVPVLQQLAAIVGDEVLVLGQVRTLGVNLSTRGDQLVGGVVMITDGPQQANLLAASAKREVAHLLELPGVGLTPAADVLRSVQMEARGERTTITGTIRIGTLAALLEFAPALTATRVLPTPPATRDATEDAGTAPAPEARPPRRDHRPKIVDAPTPNRPDLGKTR